jgi:hypothetical protein
MLQGMLVLCVVLKLLADFVILQTILDCSEANEGFYVKCGYKRAGLEMAHYYDKPKTSHA